MHCLLFILIFFSYIITSKPDPQTKDFFISINGLKCALLSLSADLSVEYEISKGTNTIKLSLDNTSSSQEGVCGTSSSNSTAQFNVSINGQETVSFGFKSINNDVIWRNIIFNYQLPNFDFPNATSNGTISAESRINKVLSSSSQFYKCLSRNDYNLSHGVILHVYSIKLKVFNVLNDSYGSNVSECAKNILTSSTESQGTTKSSFETTTEIFGSTTSKLITTTNIVPTTSVTIKPYNITSSTMKTTTMSYLSTVPPFDAKFAISDKTKVCLLLQSKMTISVTYNTPEKKVIITFSVTSYNKFNGSCSADEDNITVYFTPESFFFLSFIKEDAKIKLHSFKLYVILTSKFFPDAKYPNTVINMVETFGSVYEVPLGKGYFCRNSLMFGNSTTKLDVQNFKFEAFRTSNSNNFLDTDPKQCSSGLTIGQIVSIILFALTLSILVGLSIISLLRKCARYYRYQKVRLQDTI